jgi:RNA polymerase-binding transcription factor DksA
MADEIDTANDRILADIERRIAAARLKPVERGSAECVECEDTMPEERRAIGATLCFECAQRHERIKKLYARP